MKSHELFRRYRLLLSGTLAVAVGILAPFESHGQGRVLTATVSAANVGDLRQWDARIEAMTRGGELRSRSVTEDTLVPGRVHERFDQYYRGIRIWGGDLARQSERGVSISVFGTLYEGLSLQVDPVLSTDDARRRVMELSGATALGDQPGNLFILPLENGSFALTYRYQVFTASEAAVYFIDAIDGQVRLKHDLLQSEAAVVQGTGIFGDTKKVSVSSQSGTYFADDQLRPPSLRTFDLRGNLSRAIDVLNGVVPLATADLATD